MNRERTFGVCFEGVIAATKSVSFDEGHRDRLLTRGLDQVGLNRRAITTLVQLQHWEEV